MKMFRFAAAFALFLAASPAVAQWQTPNHSTPIGRGGGVIGFGAAAPGASGQPLVSTGATTDPGYGQAANNGIAPGAANTVKGSLDGVSTSDVAVPTCTGLGQAIRWAAGVGPNCGTVVATTGFDMPVNLGLSASAASSSLTLTVTQASGSVPTAGNPVAVPFRSTTASSGVVSVGSIASSLTLTIPNGASLGTTNSVPFRVWIFLNANSGTPALGVATCSNTTSIFPCTAWESTLKTSTTISAGATSGGTLYAAVGVASDAVRIVGYCDYAGGLATAGAWTSACTTLQVMGPGTKKPGDTVQTIFATSTATVSAVSTTKVQAVPTVAITPTSTPNLIAVRSTGTLANDAGAPALGEMQLSRSTSFTGIGGLVFNYISTANPNAVPVTLEALDAPGTTSSTTYVPFIWAATAVTVKYNSVTATINGTPTVTIRVDEIMG